MKINASLGRKLRYGGTSAALTALIIAAVIVINIIFSAVTQSFMLYTDLTPPLHFTLSEECLDLIENGDDSVAGSSSPIEMIKKFREENKKYNTEKGLSPSSPDWRDEELMLRIILCDDPDAWKANLMQRYIATSAHELEAAFPDYIEVVYIDTVRNPSAVSKYKENSLSLIYDDTVIVECGSEFRTRTTKAFYTYDSATSETPWAYNGEKALAADILAVTRAENPVACIDVSHGTAFEDYEFLQTLYDAGFDVQDINLVEDDIPENCRLMVIMNPTQDYRTGDDGMSDVDEIGKLDAALERGVSLMVFMNPETQKLVELESFLEEWGIVFDRTDGDSHLVRDPSQAVSTDGYAFFSEYAKENRHSGMLSDLTSRPTPPEVVFKNAMSISYSDSFTLKTGYINEDDESTAYQYATKMVDGVSTSIYDVFVTSDSAEAWAKGGQVEKAVEGAPLKLMTVSSRTVIKAESSYTAVSDHTFVFACGSTDFASLAALQGKYGNNDVLLSVFRTVGKEITPIGLSPKAFSDTTIDIVTTSAATQYTVVFSVVPAVVALAAGIIVLVRRKNR